MIRINLLPYRAARKKENVRRQLNIFIGSVILVFGIIFLVNSYMGNRIKGLESEISNTRTQVAKYQQINKEIAEIKQKLAVLDRKIEVIKSLEQDRKAPVQNLDSLYHLLVEKRMWYTMLEEKAGTIKISGVSVDNQTVADFMTRLEKSERFTNVRLAAIKQQQSKQESLNLKAFDVNFQRAKIDTNTTTKVKK
jgi:type IV pilus assembly protein PilN